MSRGRIEVGRRKARHWNAKTIGLYDLRGDEVSAGETGRIGDMTPRKAAASALLKLPVRSIFVSVLALSVLVAPSLRGAG